MGVPAGMEGAFHDTRKAERGEPECRVTLGAPGVRRTHVGYVDGEVNHRRLALYREFHLAGVGGLAAFVVQARRADAVVQGRGLGHGDLAGGRVDGEQAGLGRLAGQGIGIRLVRVPISIQVIGGALQGPVHVGTGRRVFGNTPDPVGEE